MIQLPPIEKGLEIQISSPFSMGGSWIIHVTSLVPDVEAPVDADEVRNVYGRAACELA